MRIRVKDYNAEKKAWDRQQSQLDECYLKPYPFNVPNFLPFTNISCYREIDTEDIFFDENGDIKEKTSK